MWHSGGMKLTPQHERILAIHADGDWHCSTEIEFIRDQRKRISELNHGGYTFESMKCNICAPHKHNSNLKMRRLVTNPIPIERREPPITPTVIINGQRVSVNDL